jgi:Plavaka transposase
MSEQRCSPDPNQSTSSSATSRALQTFQTPLNVFGLFRKYLSDKLPSHDPEEHVNLQDLSNGLGDESRRPQGVQDEFYPYPNKNSFLLGDWYWNHGKQKSHESFRGLLSIVGDPDFRPDDVRDTQWRKIDIKIGRNDFDKDDNADGEWMDEDAGWKRTPVVISVPFSRRHTKTPGPKNFVVGDLYHRSFVSVIREKLANPQDDRHFHYEPFELFWRPPDSDTRNDVQLHGELYTSPAFLKAHRELQESPGEPGCQLPRVVVAMMFWSDVTHLTSFGTAKLWPAYVCFGNESKYRRCKPTCHLFNHVAYFQSVSHRLPVLFPPCFIPNYVLQLPDRFKDFASEHMGGKRPNDKFMAHCRRELLHTQWDILLDDEFLTAYQHGIVVECCDRIVRWFYPRLLTYSADYKEKCVGSVVFPQTAILTKHRIILAGIRDLGCCPCPRCLVQLTNAPNMGQVRDMKQRRLLARVDDEITRDKVNLARDFIYNRHYVVNSKAVEYILKAQSLVPTLVSVRLTTGRMGD